MRQISLRQWGCWRIIVQTPKSLIMSILNTHRKAWVTIWVCGGQMRHTQSFQIGCNTPTRSTYYSGVIRETGWSCLSSTDLVASRLASTMRTSVPFTSGSLTIASRPNDFHFVRIWYLERIFFSQWLCLYENIFGDLRRQFFIFISNATSERRRSAQVRRPRPSLTTHHDFRISENQNSEYWILIN